MEFEYNRFHTDKILSICICKNFTSIDDKCKIYKVVPIFVDFEIIMENLEIR